MPKIRALHPGFWTDTTLAECSRDARMLYMGLWNFSDDVGVFELSNKLIKAQVFPFDDISIEELMNELIRCGRIVKFYHDNKTYGLVVRFTKYQNPNSKYPKKTILDDSVVKNIRELGKNILSEEKNLPSVVCSSSCSSSCSVEDGSLRSTIGAEEKNLALSLAEGIRETNPAFAQKFSTDEKLKSKIEKWAADIDKLKRIDKATDEQISFVINWLFKSETKDSQFWRVNIESGRKLREKFQTLVGVIKREREQKPKVTFIS